MFRLFIFNTVIDLVRIKSVYFVFLSAPFVMYSQLETYYLIHFNNKCDNIVVMNNIGK